MPTKKRNELRYIDGYFAVYDDAGASASTQEEVSWLLKLGTNEQNPDKPFRELFERCGSPVSGIAFAPGCDLSDVDAGALRELGYEVMLTRYNSTFCGLDGLAAAPLGEVKPGRHIVALRNVERLADILMYFSKLVLLSLGDTRHGDVISLRADSDTKTGIRFEADIPLLGFGFSGEWLSKRVFEILDFPGFECSSQQISGITLHVESLLSRNGLEGDIPKHDGARRILAARYLLAAVYDAATSARYIPGYETGLPESTNRGALCDAIIEAAHDGRLKGCPRCGWPVLRVTDGADAYCRKSHRNKDDRARKREEAMDLLESGASVEETLKSIRKGKGYYFTERQIRLMAKQIRGE